MTTSSLTIDLAAIRSNWQSLAARSAGQTGAVVKAGGYGLGAAQVAQTLARAGARHFFVAVAEEGRAVRNVLGGGYPIYVFGGHMEGDAPLIRDHDLTPMLNSAEQLARHLDVMPDHSFGIQLDSGMNRLGMEPAEWAGLRERASARGPALIMSHLACADEPDHPMNAAQLSAFRGMTDGVGVPRSLAATGGILLGPEYHFDLTRPGIGLYGGLPFADAMPVVTLALPVIQIRDVAAGESVGYGNSWIAARASRVATLSAGYADGIHRILSNAARLWAGDTPCPLVGRVSMDLITADVTDLGEAPQTLTLLCDRQTVDDVAEAAHTIGYEVLTSLGGRYARTYVGG